MRQKQLHVWLADADYQFLAKLATENDETLSALLRRVIRKMRRHMEYQPGSTTASVRGTANHGDI